jgi:hypothetical protein
MNQSMNLFRLRFASASGFAGTRIPRKTEKEERGLPRRKKGKQARRKYNFFLRLPLTA